LELEKTYTEIPFELLLSTFFLLVSEINVLQNPPGAIKLLGVGKKKAVQRRPDPRLSLPKTPSGLNKTTNLRSEDKESFPLPFLKTKNKRNNK